MAICTRSTRRMAISSGPPVADGGPITSSPTVANGVAYVGCSDQAPNIACHGNLYAFDATKWDLTLDRSHQCERRIDRCVADRCQRDGLSWDRATACTCSHSPETGIADRHSDHEFLPTALEAPPCR